MKSYENQIIPELFYILKIMKFFETILSRKARMQMCGCVCVSRTWLETSIFHVWSVDPWTSPSFISTRKVSPIPTAGTHYLIGLGLPWCFSPMMLHTILLLSWCGERSNGEGGCWASWFQWHLTFIWPPINVTITGCSDFHLFRN